MAEGEKKKSSCLLWIIIGIILIALLLTYGKHMKKQQTTGMAAQMQTPIEMERIRAEGRLVEKRMQNQQDMIELQAKTIADMEKHSKELAFKYDQLAAELAKINAEFDKEPVPDKVSQLR